MRKYDDNGFEHLNFLDDWGFGPDYRDKIAKLFAEEYVDIMKRYLGIDIELVGYDIDSPKEYNFRTDRIFTIVDVSDYDTLVEKLCSLASNPIYRTKIAQTIKNEHTSCDGFWSWMSNDIEEWFGLMVNPDNSHYTSYFIGYLLDAICPAEIENLNEAIYSYVSESTDYHCVEPETDEAKEEYELYLKYGILYADYAEEHPIRYPDPNRPTYYTEDDWDDYKESFMEYLETYEEEQKRKAAIKLLKEEGYSYRQLAAMFGCSKWSIQNIIHPQIHKAAKKRSTAYWTEKKREYRKRKQALYKSGQLYEKTNKRKRTGKN